jgi:DUF917 family protein
MGTRSDRSARQERDTRSVTGHGCEAQRGHTPVETPQETNSAIARIKALFIDIERKIDEERKQKNPNAVALGKLGGVQSGKVRRARSSSANKNQKRPTDPSGSSTSPSPV